MSKKEQNTSTAFIRAVLKKHPNQSPLDIVLNGNHQFTALGDTNHSDSMIAEAVLEAIPAMAAAGIKHLMLENNFPLPENIEAKFPEVTGDFEEMQDSLEEVRHNFIVQKTTKETLKNPSLNFDQVWQKAIDPDDEDYQWILNALYALEAHILLRNYRQNLTANNEAALREFFGTFESFYQDDEAKNKKLAKAKSEIMVAAERHNIQIHFSDNREGSYEINQLFKFLEKRDNFLKKHPYLKKYNKIDVSQIEDVEAYLDTLSLSDEERPILKEGIEMQMEWEAREYSDDAFARRISPESEERRADRFIKLAKGERAAIFWGSGHFDKARDINEFLDEKLSVQAEENGASFEPTKVIELWGKRNDFLRKESYVDDPDARYFIAEGEIDILESNLLDTAPQPNV